MDALMEVSSLHSEVVPIPPAPPGVEVSVVLGLGTFPGE